jgi:hypothetical protein
MIEKIIINPLTQSDWIEFESFGLSERDHTFLMLQVLKIIIHIGTIRKNNKEETGCLLFSS